MLAFANGMALGSQAHNLVDEALRDFVKVDEKTARICEHIKCLVEVFPVVYLLDQLHDDVGDAINLPLVAHKVDLVVKGLGDL